jgi:hypothetical protein
MRKNIKVFVSSIVFLYGLAMFDFSNAAWTDNPVPVNGNATDPNEHHNSGHKRIARINNVTFVLTPDGSSEEAIWKSSNNGRSWERFGVSSSSAYSGSLISGANETIYHFYREGRIIYMRKFRYNETVFPSRETVYSAPAEGTHGAYNMLTAIVDGNGNLYVATHWDTGGGQDSLFIFRSSDEGETWQGPYTIASGDGDHSYGFVSLEVNIDNIIVAAYSEWGSESSYFAKSDDPGQIWKTQDVTTGEPGVIYNPHILPVGSNNIFIFAQRDGSASRGLVFKRSTNLGASWGAWTLIDPTCGYADPGAGLGSDTSTIYVAFRSSNGTGVTSGTCGDQSRSRLAVSRNLGQSWSFPDDNYDAARTGTRNNVRYQTWFNYGGPLEWIWMQYADSSGASRPIYYDVNLDESIDGGDISGQTAGPRCVSQKLKTASALCAALTNCWVKEIKEIIKDKYPVEEFTDKAILKFKTSWGKAQSKAVNKGINCDAGSEEEIGSTIDVAFEDIYEQIYGYTILENEDITKLKDYINLGGDLLKAAGKRCSSLLKADSAYVKDKSADRDTRLGTAKTMRTRHSLIALLR